MRKNDHQDLILKCFKSGGYFCDANGNVFNSKKKLSPYKKSNGYVSVQMTPFKGKYIKALVHKCVYLFFKGPYNKDLELNHIDGNKGNNRPENIQTVTHSENLKHAFRTGLHSQLGSKHRWAKLTEEQVKNIRKEYKWMEVTYKMLAKKYGVCTPVIFNAINGKTWKQVC